MSTAESTPLLNGIRRPQSNAPLPRWVKIRAVIWSLLTLLFVGALVLVSQQDLLPDSWAPLFGKLPRDPMLAALSILSASPIIDGHVDLPILARMVYANNASAIDLASPMPAHVDIPRLRKGKVGAFFWSVYVDCPDPSVTGDDFVNATWRVRDTLEQIDVSRLLIEKYPDTFKFATSHQDVLDGIQKGKIASLLGVEGAHQLGNSLAVLRMYQQLGVKYVTLSHICHNAFADSCGYYPGMEPLHGGLSEFGQVLVSELNRLSIFVDLSHTSDDTARQALKLSNAPVIWSHSSARAVHDHVRNVPDDVLELIGEGEGKKDAVVMVNFSPTFVADDGEADVSAVADHVEHIARVAGKKHVGIGSDFDGIVSVPDGLEDVSMYPALFAELIKRGGWTARELAGLAGGNLLRVMKRMEEVGAEMRRSGAMPAYDIYEKRTDIPRL